METFRKHRSIESICSAIIVSSIFIETMILMKPLQDTGDDAMMAWQLSRGLGSLASFLSPYLSLLFSALYHYVPVLPWWSLLHVAGAWILLIVALRLVMTAKHTRMERAIICVILFAAVWLAVMRRMNFTRTAAAFVVAGAVLCLEYILAEKRGERTGPEIFVLGEILLLLGCMIRFNMGLLLMPFPIILLIILKMDQGPDTTVSMKKAGIGVLAISAGVVLLAILNVLFWNSNPEWKEYRKYSGARAAIVDYAEWYPSWEQASEQYQACGLKDANDLDILLHKAYIGDPDVFSLETLRSISGLKGISLGAWNQIHIVVSLFLQMLTEGKILLWLFFLLFYLYLRKGRRVVRKFGILAVPAILELLYFSIKGRILLRIWEPILLCLLLLLLVLYGIIVPEETIEKVTTKRECLFSAVLAVALFFYSGIAADLSAAGFPTAADDRDEVTRARAECIQAMPDKIFLLSQPLFHHPPTPSPFGLWEALPAEDYLGNYFALSNWEANTPVNRRRLADLGITNPTKALIEQTDTYSEFMDDKLYRYLKSHYGSNITCSFVGEFPDGGVYLQYTAPLAEVIGMPGENGSDRVDSNLKIGISQPAITIMKSEADPRYQIKAWNLEGRINDWDSMEDCKALYCDMRKADGQEYTFRLALEKDGFFHAFFYDIDEGWMGDVIEKNLIVLLNDGKYINLGDF